MSPDKPAEPDESTLRAVLDATADGLLVVGEHGHVVTSNRRFAEMWHIPDELLVNGDDQKLLDYVLEQLVDPDAFVRKVRELYQSRAEDLDLLSFKDGRVFERFSAPLLSEGRIAGRVWSFRDVTERRRAEEQRRQFEASIRDAQKLESLGLLAGGIAHDFNNLLTGVLGNTKLVLDRLEDSALREPLEDVVDGARRAADLCTQMLAYSGKGRFQVEPVDLSAVVRGMEPLLEVSAAHRAVLAYDLAPDLPAVLADVTQLRQVLMNLVTNAADASAGRDGSITISTGRRYCDTEYLAQTEFGNQRLEGEYVELAVEDQGTGMTPEERERMFEPFFSSKPGGHGLGLAATHGIVRGHSGVIDVRSTPDHGTLVRVLFPTTELAVHDLHDAGGPAAGWRGEGTVLIVDDEPGVRAVARRSLEAAGFDVLDAADGRSGLALYTEQRTSIRVVLLDLTMPGLDGLATLAELRRIDPDVPVVLSSGYDRESLPRSAGQELPTAFVRKPYVPDELLLRVREALEGNEPR